MISPKAIWSMVVRASLCLAILGSFTNTSQTARLFAKWLEPVVLLQWRCENSLCPHPPCLLFFTGVKWHLCVVVRMKSPLEKCLLKPFTPIFLWYLSFIVESKKVLRGWDGEMIQWLKILLPLQLPASTWGGSQFYVTPVPRDLTPSSVPCRHLHSCACACVHACTRAHTHTI